MPKMTPRRLLPLCLAICLAVGLLPASAQAQQVAPLVAIDPGHGSNDWGTSGSGGGKRLIEKELTLALSRQTSDLLKQAGYRTLLLRTDDTAVNAAGQDRNGDGKLDLADELQARADKANEAGAAILLSVHFNGSTDRSLRGPEVYYSAARPFAAENRRLADTVMAAITRRLGEVGRPVTPRGVLRDSVLGGSLFLLGPKGGRIARPSAMPGILIEGLFLTNDEDAALVADPAAQKALARAFADGVASYLGPPPKPAPSRARVINELGAFLRPAPLLGAAPLAELEPGETVAVAEAARGDEVGGTSEWWRVDFKGKAGYIFAPLLEAVMPTHVTVKNDDGRAARLRAEPSVDSRIVGRAQPGERLELVDAADGEAVDGRTGRWLKVQRGSIAGWVWAPLVDH